jgi:hypothetical protein
VQMFVGEPATHLQWFKTFKLLIHRKFW